MKRARAAVKAKVKAKAKARIKVRVRARVKTRNRVRFVDLVMAKADRRAVKTVAPRFVTTIAAS